MTDDHSDSTRSLMANRLGNMAGKKETSAKQNIQRDISVETASKPAQREIVEKGKGSSMQADDRHAVADKVDAATTDAAEALLLLAGGSRLQQPPGPIGIMDSALQPGAVGAGQYTAAHAASALLQVSQDRSLHDCECEDCSKVRRSAHK